MCLYQGSVLSRRNTCRDYGSEVTALSMRVSIFYKRDNIHPDASFVLLPSAVIVDKIAEFLEENESVAAHHGLCSQNPP